MPIKRPKEPILVRTNRKHNQHLFRLSVDIPKELYELIDYTAIAADVNRTEIIRRMLSAIFEYRTFFATVFRDEGLRVDDIKRVPLIWGLTE